MPEPGNPQALNRYSYVLNNPIRYVDADGHLPIIPLLLVGAVVALKAVDYGWTAWDSYQSLKVLHDPNASEADKAAATANLALTAAFEAAEPDDLLPSSRLARVLPRDIAELIEAGNLDVTLARPSEPDVFVTAAADLSHYRTQRSVERRLALPPSDKPRSVVSFDYDVNKGSIASPINRPYPEFVPGGRTAGGAREWVIPNRPLRELVGQGIVRNIRVRHLKME
ncbi:MAG: polymorphic toxin type 10 domain-containing protein [Anaerolineae bacterium]|nr:polymorphic toxin type 10 domain-containing protein [Anaerolineae bacterium]